MKPRRLGAALEAFLRTEAASGVLLLGCALVALVWANLHDSSYQVVFDEPIVAGVSARQVINEGLMTIFFFVVGLEIKRELVIGELNSVRKASLPAVAALGGMIVPAVIFVAFNHGDVDAREGWGVPMATDIAFCVGIFALLDGRIPRALVVFVTALAIFDDIGGILVIALFYGHGLQPLWLAIAAALTGALFAMNRAGVKRGLAYGVVGAALWYALHHGGIHATIAGVILGLMVPARRESDAEHEAPAQHFIHLLHPAVAFVIMPLFAFANSGVSLTGAGVANVFAPVALGTAAGLFVGKQVGIFGLTLLAVKLRLAPMPGGASLAKLYGVSVIAGIGFTVALFIAALAYADAPHLLEQAKIGILLGSLAAGVAGFAILRFTPRVAEQTDAALTGS